MIARSRSVAPTTPHPLARRGSGQRVLAAVPTMNVRQLVACSTALVAAGLLFAHGFIGLRPGRPLSIILGAVLALSGIASLSVDHIAVRRLPNRPDEALHRELSRARRYGHCMVLVRIPCDDDDGVRLVARLRGTDEAWWSQGALVVLLPETDEEGAAQVIARAGDLVDPDRVRVVAFPEDGLTADALLAALKRKAPGVTPPTDPDEEIGPATLDRADEEVS